MANLTEHQRSFITLMRKGEEHARRGFELLLQRQDPEQFFDELAAAGLFDPSQAPAPVRVDDSSVRIPYWPALLYLRACAKISDKNSDTVLAEKVMKVVRAVSSFRENDGTIRDNYVTFSRFAEILGNVPNAVVKVADVDLVPGWLRSRFDHDVVAHALDEGAIKRFLASNDPGDWTKATRLLRHCLALRWQSEKPGGLDEEEAVPVVDPYWLKELISHHAEAFGQKCGSDAATIFRDAVQQLFSKGGRASWSYMFRPAVEDDAQNHSWRSADNCLVEGLRDVLLAWADVDRGETRSFVNDCLRDDVEMVRRIGIYILDARWNQFSDLYAGVVDSELFDTGHIHELFHLLRNHFEQFDEDQKAATLAAIKGIAKPEGDDGESVLKDIQRRWLEAIAGTKYPPAAIWLVELARDSPVGVPSHPDFNSYIESSWGPGPSPYQVDELVAFADQRTIVERMNAFEPQRTWRGPSTDTLVQALQQAVMAGPMSFARALPLFVGAAPTYQHGVVSGFKRLWDAPAEQQASADWSEIWPSLIAFFEKLFENPEVGKKVQGSADFTQGWLASAIADLLHAGTRNDERAYPPALLPRGWALLETLADRAEAAQQPADRDPMSQAINTPKGRTLEAIFGHALRESRLADKESGSHAATWEHLRPRFDQELEKCETGNFEFSTLSAAYIANLEYLSTGWLQAHIKEIFPTARPASFESALGGLAYSTATRRNYAMLRDAGVVDAALRLQLKGPDTRKKLIERLVLAYLWGDETLDSPRLSYSFEAGLVEDLEAASWFFWSVRGQRLSPEQITKIIAFWDKCVEWGQAQAVAPEKLFSTLATLAWSLSDAEGGHGELLLAVAPYAGIGHGAHEFLKELIRLADISPGAVAAVVGAMIKAYRRTYDYEGAMKSLIAKLAERGQRQLALQYCEQLREVDGIPELFIKLRDDGR